MSTAPLTLCFDIGGSGIKCLPVRPDGHAAGEPRREETPRPATPTAVLRVMRRLAQQAGSYQRVAIGFPGVIHAGVVFTAHNLNPAWVHFNLAAAARQRLGKPVRVANDADVAGYGAVRGRGVELVITLGTGLGSALFVGGVLVPNIELAHHPWRKEETYEEQLGRAALDAVGKIRWTRRIRKAIKAWDALFNYDRLYLGGGNAKKIAVALPDNVVIVPNREGLLGGVGLWR